MFVLSPCMCSIYISWLRALKELKLPDCLILRVLITLEIGSPILISYYIMSSKLIPINIIKLLSWFVLDTLLRLSWPSYLSGLVCPCGLVIVVTGSTNYVECGPTDKSSILSIILYEHQTLIIILKICWVTIIFPLSSC